MLKTLTGLRDYLSNSEAIFFLNWHPVTHTIFIFLSVVWFPFINSYVCHRVKAQILVNVTSIHMDFYFVN